MNISSLKPMQLEAPAKPKVALAPEKKETTKSEDPADLNEVETVEQDQGIEDSEKLGKVSAVFNPQSSIGDDDDYYGASGDSADSTSGGGATQSQEVLDHVARGLEPTEGWTEETLTGESSYADTNPHKPEFVRVANGGTHHHIGTAGDDHIGFGNEKAGPGALLKNKGLHDTNLTFDGEGGDDTFHHTRSYSNNEKFGMFKQDNDVTFNGGEGDDTMVYKNTRGSKNREEEYESNNTFHFNGGEGHDTVELMGRPEDWERQGDKLVNSVNGDVIYLQDVEEINYYDNPPDAKQQWKYWKLVKREVKA